MEEENLQEQEQSFEQQQEQAAKEKEAEIASQLSIAQKESEAQQSTIHKPEANKVNPADPGLPVQKINFIGVVKDLYDKEDPQLFDPYLLASEFIELNKGPQKYELLYAFCRSSGDSKRVVDAVVDFLKIDRSDVKSYEAAELLRGDSYTFSVPSLYKIVKVSSSSNMIVFQSLTIP